MPNSMNTPIGEDHPEWRPDGLLNPKVEGEDKNHCLSVIATTPQLGHCLSEFLDFAETSEAAQLYDQEIEHLRSSVDYYKATYSSLYERIQHLNPFSPDISPEEFASLVSCHETLSRLSKETLDDVFRDDDPKECLDDVYNELVKFEVETKAEAGDATSSGVVKKSQHFLEHVSIPLQSGYEAVTKACKTMEALETRNKDMFLRQGFVDGSMGISLRNLTPYIGKQRRFTFPEQMPNLQASIDQYIARHMRLENRLEGINMNPVEITDDDLVITVIVRLNQNIAAQEILRDVFLGSASGLENELKAIYEEEEEGPDTSNLHDDLKAVIKAYQATLNAPVHAQIVRQHLFQYRLKSAFLSFI